MILKAQENTLRTLMILPEALMDYNSHPSEGQSIHHWT